MSATSQQVEIEQLLSKLQPAEVQVDIKHQQALRRALLNSSCASDNSSSVCFTKVASWTVSVVTGGVGVVMFVVVLQFFTVTDHMVVADDNQNNVVATDIVSSQIDIESEFIDKNNTDIIALKLPSESPPIVETASFTSENTFVAPALKHVQLLMKPVSDLTLSQ